MDRTAMAVPAALAALALAVTSCGGGSAAAGGVVAGAGTPQAMAGPLVTVAESPPRDGGSDAAGGVAGIPGRSGSRRLVVVLDPGHNGGNAAHPEIMGKQVPAGFGQRKDCNTAGAQTRGGYAEHAFTFDVAQRVRRLLTAHGVEVWTTRQDDSGVGPCVDQRAAYGNARHADAVVAIHADSSPVGHGFHVIEAERPPAGAGTAAASHRLAVAVHDHYLAGSGFAPATYLGEHGYDRRADLAGLNLSARPTVFVECGNMLDATDAARMQSAAGRERLARALAAGILAYLGQR